MSEKDKITVQGAEITIISGKGNDYISLTIWQMPKKAERGQPIL